jgi:hypothetical protein
MVVTMGQLSLAGWQDRGGRLALIHQLVAQGLISSDQNTHRLPRPPLKIELTVIMCTLIKMPL